MCEPGTCEDCCSTDEWIGSADLKRPPTATVSGPLAPEPPSHAPALTPRGFSAALRALGRDGGER